MARLAHVSKATASRALSGSPKAPSPQVTKRVLVAAAELGYSANAQARSLKKGSSGIVGLIVHNIADPRSATIAKGVLRASQVSGKQLLLADTDGSPTDEKTALEALASHAAEAVVLAGSRSTAPEDELGNEVLRQAADSYMRRGGSLTVIGHALIGLSRECESVLPTPDEELSEQLAVALAEGGARHFTIVPGPEHMLVSDMRLKGFQRGLQKAGLPSAEVVREGNRAGEHGAIRRIAKGMVERRAAGIQSAMFAVDDKHIVGLVVGLLEHGLEPLRDYSLGGLDEAGVLKELPWPVVALRVPLTDLGCKAAKMAIAHSHAT